MRDEERREGGDVLKAALKRCVLRACLNDGSVLTLGVNADIGVLCAAVTHVVVTVCCRSPAETPQGDELRGGRPGPRSGGLGVQVQRERGAGGVRAAVSLEHGDPPQ